MKYIIVVAVCLALWGLKRWRRRMLDAVRIATLPLVLVWHACATLWSTYKWVVGKWKMWRRKPAYGNSSWATPAELKAAGNLSAGGFVVGHLNGKVVRTRWEHSLLMFGRPGSGKSLTMGASLHAVNGETLVVYDPPGALLNRFRTSLEAKGYRILEIDLNEPLAGAVYDVCAGLDGASVYEREGRLKQLADLVTADLRGSGKNDEHFADTARILVQGILEWLHQNDRPNATLYGVSEILLSASAVKRGGIFKQIVRSGSAIALSAVNMWEAAEAAKGGEASGFRSSVTRALGPWMTRAYQDLTRPDGREVFSWKGVFASIEPTAVFLTGGVLKSSEVKSFVRVFFGQAAGTLASMFSSQTPLRRTKLMIDEGVVLGRCMPVLAAVEEMRKVGVTVFIGYQSMAQLRDIWGKNAGSMLDCCDVVLSGGSKTPKDYLDFSQLIGSRTIKTLSKSAQGVSESEAGRHLWAIEDSFRMDDSEALALLGNHAVLVRKPYRILGEAVRY